MSQIHNIADCSMFGYHKALQIHNWEITYSVVYLALLLTQ